MATDSHAVPGNPYNWRAWLRVRLPWPLWHLVFKGRGCELVGSTHGWYKCDNESSAYYHCKVERSGQLWRNG